MPEDWHDPPLTWKEKRELNNALKDVTNAPSEGSALFALFMLIGWPLIWVAIVHFMFHF